jgi:hypothetical protein
MYWPCLGQATNIFKRPRCRFVEVLVEVGQHRRHAVERRVDEHGLQLDFKPTVLS